MTIPVGHNPLADQPPVAAVPGGGPDQGPGLLVKPKNFKYEVVPGYFLQTGPKPKHHDFEYMLEHSFGMIDESPERWSNLKRDIRDIQDRAEPGVQYKVFFLGRHGEGWHNYSVSQIGVEPWEEKWAFEYGNGELTWGPDPELTKTGIAQAQAIQKCWKEQAPLGAPIRKEEMRWYVSPLTRTAQTMLHSWGELLTGTPEVWEDWREVYGSHTCDQRRSKTYIQKTFPEFKIEPGFEEEDVFWKPDIRETDEQMQIRGQRGLDRLFGNGPDHADETYISITAHSGNLRNLLAVIGHQPYPLATGEMIPVIIKATALTSENGSNVTTQGQRNGNGSAQCSGHA